MEDETQIQDLREIDLVWSKVMPGLSWATQRLYLELKIKEWSDLLVEARDTTHPLLLANTQHRIKLAQAELKRFDK